MFLLGEGGGRIVLIFPVSPLPLAQGKLKVGVFPEQARMQEKACLGVLSGSGGRGDVVTLPQST